MKRILAILLIAPAAFAAPQTPITRGRLTTDLDAGGHTVTNSNLATTNFVWEAVGTVTNNLPSGGGISTNDVRGLIESESPVQSVNGYTGDVSLDVSDIAGAAPVERPEFAGSVEIDGNEGDPYLGIGSQNGHPITTIFQDRILVFDADGHGHNIYFPTRGTQDEFALGSDLAGLAARTNLPPLAASATVGDIVDAVNTVINAMKKEEP